MKRLALCALLLCGSGFAATVTDPIQADQEGIRALGAQLAPCEIVGSISRTGIPHILNLQITNADAYPAAIYTHSGTGAVFRAYTSLGEGDEGPVLSSTRQDVDFSVGVVTFVVEATKAVAGAKYAIRIGNFGDVKVTFNANGGTMAATEKTKTYAPGGTYTTLPTATKDGFSFEGWHVSATNGVKIVANTPVCVGYTNLVANWVLSGSPAVTNVDPVVTNYCVRFNANGGYGNMATQSFTWGEAKALSTNTFARTNFTFRGWSTSSAGSVVYRDLQVVSNLTTVVGGTFDLYASWMPSADQFRTATAGGMTWSYTGTNGTATIQGLSSSGDGFAAAIDSAFRGTLVIPESLDGNRVAEIGESAFLDCLGVTNVVIPLTVETIGSFAFAGCTGLVTGVTIPESVTKMGSAVFTNCPALKIIRYYGDCPEADAALYAGAPSSLISGALKIHDSTWGVEKTVETKTEQTSAGTTSTESDESGVSGTETETAADTGETSELTIRVLPDRWPSGSDGRKVFWLNDVKVALVTLDCNGGTLDEDESPRRYYISGRTVGALPEPTYDLDGEEDGLAFLGWFTAQKGGVRIDEDRVVTANMKLYAHWSVGETEVGGWQTELVEDSADFDAGAAQVYEGYLYDEAGETDPCVVGTLTLKVAKGKAKVEDGETNVTASATATVKILGAKKLTLKGKIDESGEGELAAKATEDVLSVGVTADGLSGSFGDYVLAGARNRAKSSSRIDKLVVSTALSRWSGSWTVVLQAQEASGAGAACAQDCYAALSVVVGAKGKTKVTGTLPDGTKVSVSGTMIFGDGCACVPVVAPLYSGKTGGFALLLWFCTDEESPLQVWGVSGWDAAKAKVPFAASLEVVGAGRAATVSGEGSFSLAGDYDFGSLMVAEDLLPVAVDIEATRTRWNLPKADGVKFNRADEAWEITRDNGNPAGLKLTVTAKTGLFRGSFKVFGVTEAGKSKKLSAKVFGGLLDDGGYGSAFIKNVGSVPVTVE